MKGGNNLWSEKNPTLWVLSAAFINISPHFKIWKVLPGVNSEYAVLIHKCLTLYANNYMQAKNWLQCTSALTTLMYNFAMTGFFTWFGSTPPCGQNCIFLRGSAYWRVLVPPPRPIVNIYVLPSKLSGSKKARFWAKNQL